MPKIKSYAIKTDFGAGHVGEFVFDCLKRYAQETNSEVKDIEMALAEIDCVSDRDMSYIAAAVVFLGADKKSLGALKEELNAFLLKHDWLNDWETVYRAYHNAAHAQET